ncbi:GreA/GreB family elongation factor [Maribellus sp. YY47]|uniref:GreA/GreB family elongation factor n=1 Tax=Maribellus sp. YY47 TaxID=2929486 RepID=UPI0020017C78|nr:GreA/GreB family elongation factor [Maribellus sp. YY47]MCK3685108.1 GreA/GreB family elongation factor [Maribellus sp. YY47]
MEDIIKVTKMDYVRLNGIISSIKQFNKEGSAEISFLETELTRAKKIDPKRIGADFVTMNSVVEVIDLDTEKSMTIRLVYPKDANFKQGNISILSPLGSALIGYQSGSIISFKVPGGIKKMKISKLIYQPEANGDFSA